MRKLVPYMRRGPDVKSTKAAKMLNFSNVVEAITAACPKVNVSEKKIM